MLQTHDWEEKRKQGEEGEGVVKRYLEGHGYQVIRADEELFAEDGSPNPDFKVVSNSIDNSRALVGKTVEVKADGRCIETGNLCLELVSNVGTGRLGWAYTVSADFIAYYSEGDSEVCFVELSVLRRRLAESWHRLKPYRVFNSFFTGYTLAIPKATVYKLALHVGKVNLKAPALIPSDNQLSLSLSPGTVCAVQSSTGGEQHVRTRPTEARGRGAADE